MSSITVSSEMRNTWYEYEFEIQPFLDNFDTFAAVDATNGVYYNRNKASGATTLHIDAVYAVKKAVAA